MYLLYAACAEAERCRIAVAEQADKVWDATLMKKWLVSYVLESPGLEHLDFFNALKCLGAERLMSAHWVLQSDQSATALRDQFAMLLAPNDQLLVAELGQDIAWGTKN